MASSEAITEIVTRELQRLGKRRAQVYTADADLSEVRGRAYLLQVWCPQWESYVDVRDAREVEDGDRLAVTPKPKPPSVVCVTVIICMDSLYSYIPRTWALPHIVSSRKYGVDVLIGNCIVQW